MRSSLLVAAAWLVGCSRSQLVVRVDSDAGNVQIVTLQVRGPEGVGGTATATVGAGGVRLPVTLGLLAQGDVTGPVTVTAIGMNDGRAELVRQQVRTHFVAGASRDVHMTLDPACEARFCHAPTETCVAGCCVGTDAALDAIAAGATGATCTPDDVVDVAAGAGRTCLRRLGGGVDCWGTESTANLPYDTRANGLYGDARAALSTEAELALDETFGCARTAGDALACWGANDYGQVQLPATGAATAFVTRSEPIAATRGRSGATTSARSSRAA